MAPIDPLQLLKALSPLLSPEGGIRSSDEVSRLSSLMKKFSRKLVSRCIYCNVLRATSPDILEVFLELDGWSTIHMWLQEAKTAENMPFLCELLKLCQILPMSLERLKENSSPKLIKSLMKSSDENVRLTAEKVVSGWMKLIKGDSKEAVKPAREADTTVKKKKKSSSASANTPKAAPVKKDRSKGSIDESSSENSNTSCGTHGPSKSPSSSGSSEKETTSTLKEVPAKKPKVADRPKTVKTFQTRFRSTGLEEAPLPPPTKAGTKKVSRPAVDKNAVLSARQRLAPTVHAERRVKPSSLVSMGGDGRDTAGPGIRLIAPKPVHVLHEDGGFMDALTAAPAPSTTTAARRKRKPSGAATAAGPGGGKNAASSSPTSPTPAAPKFQFYKDTLETAEAVGDADSEKTKEAAKTEEEVEEDDDIGKRVKRRKRGQATAAVEGKSDGEGIESPEREDSPPTPTATGEEEGTTSEGQEGTAKASEGDSKEEIANKENEGEEKSSAVDVSSSDRPTSILSMTRKKTKKSVRWVEESKLKQFHYFELDETERVNVNNLHNFGDMKTLEMKRERQAVETARRLMGDRMEEAIPFRPPRRLTLPEPLAEPGANSQEKEIQKLRQQKTLQEIYFSKEMIPDSAYEPDPEQLSSQEPKLIPLEDENSPGGTLDYSHMELPKSSSLPPILSNLVLSIASKGQQPQGTAPSHQGVQQPPLQGGLLQGQFQGGGPMQQQPQQQQGALLQNLAGLHPGSGQIAADIQQQQTLAMMGVMGPDGVQAGMHPGGIPMGGDPNGPFMHGNSMQNPGIGMIGPPIGIGGAAGFPMGAGGPMHPHSAGANAGDWGMMHPGMPQDGAEYYSRGHHPGMGGPHMGMVGPPMGAGGVGGPHMMDMPRGGPPHGRNSRMRNHPPRVPCKYYMTSQCRFGASCSFLHPGVNGPPLQ
ncbi:serine/threonine-protein phosphatase 1 regulatory subunit 10-like isoform X2 [Dermacentor variabilis]|uniref:serine/threonine-protein phosphatase 1 regulatory subunit 10-like isoform X2 n=1 Tax=Dermacentor variabilis TaxID=34621 RepID=UPI003F5AFB2A